MYMFALFIPLLRHSRRDLWCIVTPGRWLGIAPRLLKDWCSDHELQLPPIYSSWIGLCTRQVIQFEILVQCMLPAALIKGEWYIFKKVPCYFLWKFIAELGNKLQASRSSLQGPYILVQRVRIARRSWKGFRKLQVYKKFTHISRTCKHSCYIRVVCDT